MINLSKYNQHVKNKYHPLRPQKSIQFTFSRSYQSTIDYIVTNRHFRLNQASDIRTLESANVCSYQSMLLGNMRMKIKPHLKTKTKSPTQKTNIAQFWDPTNKKQNYEKNRNKLYHRRKNNQQNLVKNKENHQRSGK